MREENKANDLFWGAEFRCQGIFSVPNQVQTCAKPEPSFLSPGFTCLFVQSWEWELQDWVLRRQVLKAKYSIRRFVLVFFPPPTKIPLLHFEKKEERETGEPRAGRTCPVSLLIDSGASAQPRRPAGKMDEALTLVQLMTDTSSTPLWLEYYLLHFSGYFVVTTVCFCGAVYPLHCLIPIPRRRPILSFKNNNFVWLDKREKISLYISENTR